MLPKIHFERWKLNKELNIYVSTFGNFKTRSKEPIKPLTSRSTRYLSINVDGKVYLAHRVVLSTFKPVEDKTLTVDHLDHNTKNNALRNLEWCTREENFKRAKEDLVETVAKTETLTLSPAAKLVFEAKRIEPEYKIIKNQQFTMASQGKCICFGEYRVKTCTAAARIILLEKELPCSDIDVTRTATEIGRYIGKNKSYMGYKFERKVI
jgi:hypothetical protein